MTESSSACRQWTDRGSVWTLAGSCKSRLPALKTVEFNRCVFSTVFRLYLSFKAPHCFYFPNFYLCWTILLQNSCRYERCYNMISFTSMKRTKFSSKLIFPTFQMGFWMRFSFIWSPTVLVLLSIVCLVVSCEGNFWNKLGLIVVSWPGSPWCKNKHRYTVTAIILAQNQTWNILWMIHELFWHQISAKTL